MSTGRTQGPTALRIATSRLGRRAVLVALIATAAVAGSVVAATPAIDGYRGIAYGGGASRPTSDKPQSKLWFTDGSWFAGMFLWKTSIPPASEYRIYRLDQASHDWTDTGTVIDPRDPTHGDYLWDEGSQTLWVLSAHRATTTVADSAIKVYRYSYSAATDTYTPAGGFPVPIPDTASVDGSNGGAHTASIARDASGRLWAVWPKGGQVMYSTSTDDGVTWSTPAQVPAQAGNPIRDGSLNQSDTATVVAFGSNVGIGWSDDEAPTVDSGGYYFAVIEAGDDPSSPASWTLERLPSLVTTAGERADNHLSMKAHGDGTVYAVGKTRKDTVNCATNRDQPLVEAFRRTPSGTWSVHLVATVGDCVSRPQIVLNEELDAAWVLLTSPNGGGAIHLKSAPLSGPDALVFRDGADTTSQPGTPFIRSATETRIDDATTTKQSLTSASGLVVLANNVPTSTGGGGKWYLHNERALSASDAVPPVGTVTIANGAAFTGTTQVSVAVPASDPGSGPSLVRLSNTPDTTDGILTDGISFSYTSPLTWTLPAGDGTKTVHAQWRDAAGNWSTVQQDTIILETVSPTAPGAPVHRLSGTASKKSIPVRLTWAAGSDAQSGVQGYIVQRSVNGGAYATIGSPTGASLNVALGNATTYRFRIATVDHAGNLSSFVSGPSFRTARYSEASSTVRYAGTWSTASSSTYIGGKARVAKERGARATFTFTGKQVAWVSRSGSSSGKARVYVNGKYVKTINLHASTTTNRKLAFTQAWSKSATRTVRIVVVGTAGHPRVTVDGFFVLR